jgi:hypothetical protein
MDQYKPTAGRKIGQLADFLRAYFEIQNVRSVEVQYEVRVTAIWSSVHGELNGNILQFLSRKELIGFKSVSKSTKRAVKNKKGKIFDTIGE